MKLQSHGILVMVALVILAVLPLAFTPASATENVELGSSILTVEAEVSLSEEYGIFRSVRHGMTINVSASSSPQAEGIRELGIRIPRSLPILELIATPTFNYSIISFNKLVNEIQISFPNEPREVSVLLTTRFEGDTTFLRNTAKIPIVSIAINRIPTLTTSYIILIPRDDGTTVTNLSRGDMVPARVSGIDYHTFTNPSNSVVVLYESIDRLNGAFLFLGVIFASSIGTTYLLSAGNRFRRLVRFSRKVAKRLTPNSVSGSLLTIYVTMAILMLALSLTFGPSPTPRVYLSATRETAEQISPFIVDAGFDFISASEGQSSFDVMASLGSYNAAVIADFTPSYVGEQGLPGLGSLNKIFIITNSSTEEFIQTSQRIWADSVILLEDPSDLTSALQGLERNSNVFGSAVDQGLFNTVVAFIGLLSFLIAFVATAFLASTIIERKSDRSAVYAIAQTIVFSVMIFSFTQMVYMANAVLLQIPLGLHAGGGSSNLTAVGLLGFGGGSRPRMAFAALGFVVGALLTREGRVKFDGKVALALALVGSFMLLNPLNGGLIFHQFLLTFTTSFTPGSSGDSIDVVKTFIGDAGNFWTTSLTTSYFIQRGVPLLYASTIAMSLYTRLERSVATVVLLGTSFSASWGFMRLADQVPTKALASIPPGLILGFAIIPLVLVLSYGEGYLRRRIRV